MNLRLIREKSKNGATLGCLFVDDRFFAFTLEDPVRERAGQPVAAWKIPGETAIPSGRYRIAITQSPRFKRLLPEILEVPGFTGIRIHPLNTARESEGCIGVGYVRERATIQQSAPATAELQAAMTAALARGESVWILIENWLSWTGQGSE